jgi:formate--tetrahydrofolate ligase
LVQTTEGTPALIHAGPFANIAHGTSSVIAQKIALDRAEYVVNECGFASDLGGEKYIDIVMPSSGIKPSAAVLVATVKAIRRHDSANADLKPGLENLAKHIDNLRKYHLPAVVGLNRFTDDRDVDIQTIKAHCANLGAEFAVNEVFSKGGAGGAELGEKVIAAAQTVKPEATQPLYKSNESFADKIATVAKQVYGASGVEFRDAAKQKLEKFTSLGFGNLPVCIAKTQNSLSDDPKKLGAPKDWTLTISDAHLSSGAGFIVAIAGNMLLMPGLPKVPQSVKMSVDTNGQIQGVS